MNPDAEILGWSFLEGIGAALIMPAGAIAVGPLIGGFATTYLSWRWVFAGESPTGPRCWGSPRWSGWCWAACSSPSRCTCRSSWAWQNTGTNLGASIGTALAGSILIAGLTASFLIGIQQNPAIPADVKAQASVDVWQSSRSPCLVF